MTNIHHVTFSVRRDAIEECVGFYESLGFGLAEPPVELADRTVWLERDGFQIHLQHRDRDGRSLVGPDDGGGGTALAGPGGSSGSSAPESPSADAGSFAHVAFVVPEYETVIAALGRAGVKADPRREYWGAKRCFVSDPAGNQIELLEAAP